MEIEHFSHRHPLSVSNNKWIDEDDLCNACGEYCDEGPIYSCSRKSYCRFKLHESCAKLPQELHNPLLHPHPLSLGPKCDGKIDQCYACERFCLGFTFRCDKCRFNLDLHCAFIRPAAIEEREEAVAGKHFSHKHPLVVLENMPARRINCNVCGKYCSPADPMTYGCFPCRFFLHQSCFERNLPQQIQHFYHPCPLTLYTHPYRKYSPSPCKACRQFCPRGAFYYGCSRRCHFVMDIDCTLLPTTSTQLSKSDYKGEILHFLHGHPLSLISNIKPDHKVIIKYCYVCGKGCTDPTYTCFHRSCNKFYIHKSCLELPQDNFDHSHPNHPLTLKPILEDSSAQCNACRKDINWNRKRNNFAYVCQSKNCSFCLHIECSVIMTAVITYEGHDHLLQFRDNIVDELIKCSACNSTCESYAFSCLDLHCDFNLHHTCGPLPYIITHKSHIHPLILTHSLAVHEDWTDDEFYCDACEEERDPLLPIYYCKECHFVAEISCVFSEVKSSLNGEYGDVELMNPLGQFGKVLITKDAVKEMIQKKYHKQLKPTLTWKDFFTFSEDENKKQKRIANRIKKTTTAEKIEAYDHEETIMFSDKAYTHFMEFLNHSQASHTKFPYNYCGLSCSTKEEVVNVGDYMITRKLAPILNHLLSNQGDIGAQSKLSPKLKSFFVCMLCECIYRMRNTRVVEITNDVLLSWWTCLKTLQFAEFQIEFAYDRLKRVTNAHFGLYVEMQVDSAIHQLDRDIEKLSVDIEALKSKRERIKFAKSAKSSLNIEECLREAFLLKKGKADMSMLL